MKKTFIGQMVGNKSVEAFIVALGHKTLYVSAHDGELQATITAGQTNVVMVKNSNGTTTTSSGVSFAVKSAIIQHLKDFFTFGAKIEDEEEYELRINKVLSEVGL